MQDWQYQFAVLGQQAIEHLQDNPHQGPEAAVRLRQLLNEFRRTSRNKNSTRGYMPHRKDGMDMAHAAHAEGTVNMKDAHGKDVEIPLAAFQQMTSKVSRRRKVKVSERTYADDDGFEALDIEEEEEGDEDEDDLEDRRRAKMQRYFDRQAWAKGAVKYNWRYQGKRIAWEWVELAGKAMIVGFVIVGTIWVASRLLTPDDVRMLPREGGDGGGGGGGGQ